MLRIRRKAAAESPRCKPIRLFGLLICGFRMIQSLILIDQYWRLVYSTKDRFAMSAPTNDGHAQTRGNAVTPRLYVGTGGFSVWFSNDLGQTFDRLWGS